MEKEKEANTSKEVKGERENKDVKEEGRNSRDEAVSKHLASKAKIEEILKKGKRTTPASEKKSSPQQEAGQPQKVE